MTAHLFGWVALAPLIAYGARGAGASGGAGLRGARRSFLAARAALFWSALAGGAGGARRGAGGRRGRGGRTGRRAWLGALRLAALGFWMWIFAASLAEAEGFAATVRVAAVVVAAFAGIGGLLALAAGGTVA